MGLGKKRALHGAKRRSEVKVRHFRRSCIYIHAIRSAYFEISILKDRERTTPAPPPSLLLALYIEHQPVCLRFQDNPFDKKKQNVKWKHLGKDVATTRRQAPHSLGGSAQASTPTSTRSLLTMNNQLKKVNTFVDRRIGEFDEV